MSNAAIFTKNELDKLIELACWGAEKKKLKDPDFISAYSKLKELHTGNESAYQMIIIPVETEKEDASSYAKLSIDAMDYINRRIENGYKNTYHSIMSILGNKRKNGEDIDKATFRKEYVAKYNIEEADMTYFDEILDTCFKVFKKRNFVFRPNYDL